MAFEQEKQPSEIVPSGVDFTRRMADLPPGESINNATVLITDAGGVDVTASMQVGAINITGNKVSIKVQAGTVQRYHEQFVAYTTPGGYRLEEDVYLNVVEE